MDTHARRHGGALLTIRAERLSRLRAENQGRRVSRWWVNDRFTWQNLRKLWRFKMGNMRSRKSPQTFSRPLAHQGKATRRDVAPMVANFCSYTDVF